MYGINDIVALANAGFSRVEIAAIINSQAQIPATPAQAPATPAQVPATPAQVPATPAQAPATPAQAPAAHAQLPDPMSQLLASVQTLTQTVQANGLMGTQMPKTQTADDILASIINPPKKEEK